MQLHFNLNETICTVTKHQLHGVFVSKRNNPYRTQWTIYVLIAHHPNTSFLLLHSYKIPKFQEAAFVKKNSCFKNHPLHPTQAAQCTTGSNVPVISQTPRTSCPITFCQNIFKYVKVYKIYVKMCKNTSFLPEFSWFTSFLPYPPRFSKF